MVLFVFLGQQQMTNVVHMADRKPIQPKTIMTRMLVNDT